METHWCARCKESRPLREWEYISHRHAWCHVRTFEAIDVCGTTIEQPCGWIEKIPAKV